MEPLLRGDQNAPCELPWGPLESSCKFGLIGFLGDGLSSLFVFMCAFSYDWSVCGFVHMNASA